MYRFLQEYSSILVFVIEVASTNKGLAKLKKPAQKAKPAVSTVQRPHNNCGHMKRFKAAFSKCAEVAKVGQNGAVFPPSPQ